MNRLSYLIRTSRGDETQDKFSRKLGVSRCTYIKIEKGKISSKSIKKIAVYLKMTIGEALHAYNEQI